MTASIQDMSRQLSELGTELTRKEERQATAKKTVATKEQEIRDLGFDTDGDLEAQLNQMLTDIENSLGVAEGIVNQVDGEIDAVKSTD